MWLEQRLTAAKGRCENPNDRQYHLYGGRGVRFCFPSVIQAGIWILKNVPNVRREYEMDRIDNNGHYAPGNIRFVPREKNLGNRRVTVLSEWDQEYWPYSRNVVTRMLSSGKTREEIIESAREAVRMKRKNWKLIDARLDFMTYEMPAHITVSGRLVHNCGYGGGVGALKAMGAKMPEKEMQPLVDAWRAANPNIVAFWGALDRAARTVIRRKTSARVGKVILYWQDDKMFMRLPSGRNLCYQSPHFTENRFGSDAIGYYAPNAAGQMVVQETFGGKLAENATQAIARDILAHALLMLEKSGYPVVFHVHDEAVIEMPIGQGSLEEACRLMAITPDWAKDLPLRADGYECAYYRKD